MKLNKYIEEAEKLITDEDLNITQTAKRLCEKYKIPYDDYLRRELSKVLKKKGINNGTSTSTNQYESVTTLSALKPDGSIMNVQEYCAHYKLPYDQVRSYKLVTHGGKAAYYNIASHTIEETTSREEFRTKLLEDLRVFSPEFPQLVRTLTNDGHLLVVDPCDLHIGKLALSFETGEEYNNQIAIQRAKEGVDGILKKASGYCIDKILFIAGNDILHIDTPKRTTTSGTPQDTDGMWYSNFLLAKDLYVELIQKLLTVADVHFTFNPSNHDYTHGFFLADVIKTYFKDCPNITFDCSIHHRKYFRYFNNLIGTTHGDGAKTEDLPALMAQEAKDWSDTKHRYIYTHHTHHKASKDYIGVTIESMRSATGADGWHSRNGYQHAPKAIEGFLHCKTHGQVSRITHIF